MGFIFGGVLGFLVGAMASGYFMAWVMESEVQLAYERGQRGE